MYKFECMPTYVNGTQIPIWDRRKHDKTYMEFELYAETEEFTNNNTDWLDEINHSFFTCHICNVNVPTLFSKQHNASTKHKTFKHIIEICLDRLKHQINNNTVERNTLKQTNAHFCDSCSIAVPIHDKFTHSISEEHFSNVVKNDKLVELEQLLLNIKEVKLNNTIYMKENSKFDVAHVESDTSASIKNENTAKTNEEDKTVTASSSHKKKKLPKVKNKVVALNKDEKITKLDSTTAAASSFNDDEIVTMSAPSNDETVIKLDYKTVATLSPNKNITTTNENNETVTMSAPSKDETVIKLNYKTVAAFPPSNNITATKEDDETVPTSVPSKKEKAIQLDFKKVAMSSPKTSDEDIKEQDTIVTLSSFNKRDTVDIAETSLTYAQIDPSDLDSVYEENYMRKIDDVYDIYVHCSLCVIDIYDDGAAHIDNETHKLNIKSVSDYDKLANRTMKHRDFKETREHQKSAIHPENEQKTVLTNNYFTFDHFELQDGGKNLFCKFCKQTIPNSSLDCTSHMQSARHNSMTSSVLTNNCIRPTDSGKYFCECCNLDILKGFEYVHISNKIHRAKIDSNTGKSETEIKKKQTINTTKETNTDVDISDSNKDKREETKISSSSVKANRNLFHFYNVTSESSCLSCLVCNVKVPNATENIEGHATGTKHTHKYNLLLAENKMVDQTNSIYCRVCSKHVKKNKVFEHINNNVHEINIVSNKHDTPTVDTKNSNKENGVKNNNNKSKVANMQSLEQRVTVEHPEISTVVQSDFQINKPTPILEVSHYLFTTSTNINTLNCVICEVPVPSLYSMSNEHVLGKKHSSKYNKILADNSIKVAGKYMFCEICNRPIDVRGEIIHIKSAEHQKKVTIKNVKRENICKVPNKDSIDTHIESKTHETYESNLNIDVNTIQPKFQVNFIDDLDSTCRFCSVEMKKPEMLQHLTTYEHVQNLQEAFLINKMIFKKTHFECIPCNLGIAISHAVGHLSTLYHKKMLFMYTTDDIDT